MARQARAGAPVALVLLACLGQLCYAAPAFEPAKWNQHDNYSAVSVPYKLLFPPPSEPQGDPGGEDAGPLFPIQPRAGQSELERTCAGPDRAFANDGEEAKSGACWYGLSGPGIYTFWQRLPGDLMRRNNCYCYAVDRAGTDGWCLPGLGAGLGDLTGPITCADLSARVAADGAVAVPKAEALSSGLPADADSHYIALRLRAGAWCGSAAGRKQSGCGPDFHLLRQDASGLWSHKIGSLPATDRDALGRVIPDPSPGAAPLPGGFEELCGFFRVKKGTMRVGTQWSEDGVFRALERWRRRGLTVLAAPLPYDAATDGVAPPDDEGGGTP